jgi:pyrimidine operon attenuation protein / uracil phosphoribosyltransferase
VVPITKHDTNAVEQALQTVVAAIHKRHQHTSRLLLLGIANGGIILTRRLAQHLRAEGMVCGTGTIDISFHRDDIGRQPIPKEFSPTIIPHDINGAVVILVDDVLHTGRTVKAALDELFDHGRPDSVELAVLFDRGGRRLPVAADYCGMTITATSRQRVRVNLDASQPQKDFIAIENSRSPRSTP